MRAIIIFLISLSYSTVAQINIKAYSEKIENGFAIYLDNNEPCPVSIKLDFKLKNLRSTKGNGKIFLLPANSKKIKITELKRIKNGAYSFTWSYKYNHGDHFQKNYDRDFAYGLPYTTGKNVKIIQGYNGSSTHQNKNAIDFDLAIGEDVIAVRDAVIIKVVDHNSKSCYREECSKYNNYIQAYHDDGTFVEYVHIKKNGSLVRVGDKIKQGDVIAKSGDVGWAAGPHLHFEIFFKRLDAENKTLKTKFKIGDGKKTEYLVEKKSYLKDY